MECSFTPLHLIFILDIKSVAKDEISLAALEMPPPCLEAVLTATCMMHA